MTGKGGSAAAGLCSRCRERDPPRRSAAPAAPQLRCQVQNLKRDMKVLRASSLEVFRTCREHLQDGLSAVVAAVQRAQLCHEALLAWQSKAGHLERSLQEVSARYELEKQKRKMLHNRLVELKGNIRVHCRIRPPLPFDKEFDDLTSQDGSVPAGVVHAIDDVSDIPNTVFGEASCAMVHRVPRYFHPESNSESLLDNADGFCCLISPGARN
nr:kinesin-like protein KIF25 [Mirounga angustirostris]